MSEWHRLVDRIHRQYRKNTLAGNRREAERWAQDLVSITGARDLEAAIRAHHAAMTERRRAAAKSGRRPIYTAPGRARIVSGGLPGLGRNKR